MVARVLIEGRLAREAPKSLAVLRPVVLGNKGALCRYVFPFGAHANRFHINA